MTGCKKPHTSIQRSNSPAASESPANSVGQGAADQEVATTGQAGQADKTSYVGMWELDAGMSVEQTVKANEGKVNLLVDVRQAVQQSFNEMELSLEVKEDGTFICKQDTGVDGGEFLGNWTVEGDQATFLQTHRGDVPEEDRMVGKFSGPRLELEHVQGEIVARYVMNKKE